MSLLRQIRPSPNHEGVCEMIALTMSLKSEDGAVRSIYFNEVLHRRSEELELYPGQPYEPDARDTAALQAVLLSIWGLLLEHDLVAEIEPDGKIVIIRSRNWSAIDEWTFGTVTRAINHALGVLQVRAANPATR